MAIDSKVAFIFPGQGCQYVGMGRDLYEEFVEARRIFDKAEILLDGSIKRMCFEGPPDLLKMTCNLQPAIFVVSIACFEVFKAKFDVIASYTAGLSLGEYSALVASQSLEFEEGLKLVCKRAELMDKAAKMYPGKMLAIIGLDKDIIRKICESSGKVSIANLNCPGQVVISGEEKGIENAKDLALKEGAKKVLELEVSGAFHSCLMEEIAEEFKSVLEEKINFRKPQIPVVSNVDARPTDEIKKIKENLVKQLYSPVLWEDSVRFMISEGVSRFYEIGPGKVLKGLLKRIAPEVEVINIERKEDISNC